MTQGDKDRLQILGALAVIGAAFIYVREHYGPWLHRVDVQFTQYLNSPLADKIASIVLIPFIILAIPSVLPIVVLFEWMGWGRAHLTGARSILVWLMLVLDTWLWWYVIFPRIRRFVGLWNPFRRGRITAGRTWSLKTIVWIRDWWEMNTLFGKGPTGGWASLIEVFSHGYRDGDIFLGRPKMPWHLGAFLRPVGIPTEKHMVTIAGTGSGKSTGALIPNLCLHRGSLLCIDPKGELARITAPRRGKGGAGVRGLKQDVHVVDPFGIVPEWRSASYNPFDEMERVAEENADRPVSYAGTIAEALVKRSSRDTYWDNAAITLLRGLILYVFQGERDRRSLVEVRRLLMEGDPVGHGELDGRLQDKMSPMDVLLTKMQNVPDGPYRDAIVGAAGSLLQMGPNQMGSVLTTAQEHTAFLDIPEIRHVCARSSFLLEDLKNRRVSVYLCLPINAVSGKEGRWLRMFVLLFIDMMMRNTKAPKPPVLLAIDEFPSLGHLDGIEVVAPTMRSYGVRFWAIGQDIDQFEAVYPDTWQGFIGGAEAVQFMGITHPNTVKFIAELIGRHRVVRKDPVTGKKFDEIMPLLELEQIPRMLAKDRGNQIVWRGYKRPMLLKICPYFDYLPFWYYAPDPRYGDRWNRWIYRWGRLPEGQGRKPRRVGPPMMMPEYNPRTYERDKAEEPPPPPNPPPPPPPPKREPKAKPPAEVKKREEHRPSAPPPAPKKPVRSSAMEELDRLVGLDAIKAQVRQIADMARIEKARTKAGLPAGEVITHMVFTGNPGTGKTTVARLIGQIYKDLGVLKRGHLIELDRSKIVGQYIGHTEANMRAEIEKAMDGVLFIDEAYALAQGGGNDFGQQAIQILLKMMEDSRDRLVVIVAGYKSEMRTFIASNTGLQSRFETEIEFPDYSPSELWEIFKKMCADAQYQMTKDAMIRASDLLLEIYEKEGNREGFGNARRVRKIFRDCRARQAARLAAHADGDADLAALTLLEAEDIPALKS